MMPWYTYFAISGLLLGIALAMSMLQYAVAKDNRGLRLVRIAGVVVLSIAVCVATMMFIALTCGVDVL